MITCQGLEESALERRVQLETPDICHGPVALFGEPCTPSGSVASRLHSGYWPMVLKRRNLRVWRRSIFPDEDKRREHAKYRRAAIRRQSSPRAGDDIDGTEVWHARWRGVSNRD